MPSEILIYLCSPYSDADPAVRDARFRAVCAIAGDLLAWGHLVYVPIAHSHPIAYYSEGTDTSWETWERLDAEMIARCDEVWVAMLDGWQQSVGIAAELSIARDRGMPIRYYDPATRQLSPTP